MDKNAIYVVLFKMFVVLWQIVWVHHEEVFRTSKFELHVLLHGVLEHLVFHGCRPWVDEGDGYMKRIIFG